MWGIPYKEVAKLEWISMIDKKGIYCLVSTLKVVVTLVVKCPVPLEIMGIEI